MKKLAAVFAVLMVATLVSGCIGTGSVPRGELAVINHEMIKEDSIVVKVTVKNVSRVTVELAEVTVDFYDADKNLIDSSRDSVINLGPQETWDFEIKCREARCHEVKTYEIKTMAGTSSGGF